MGGGRVAPISMLMPSPLEPCPTQNIPPLFVLGKHHHLIRWACLDSVCLFLRLILNIACLDIKGGLSLTYEMQVWKFSHFSLKVDNGGKSGSGRWPIGCICHEIARPSSHYLYQVFSLLPLFLSSLCPLLPLFPPL